MAELGSVEDIQEERTRQVEYEQSQAKINFWLGIALGFVIGCGLTFFLLWIYYGPLP